MSSSTLASRSSRREILGLAVPAFLTLIAEPLFLLTDSVMIGHLGTAHLAGLGIAGVILQTVVGLCVFLAYSTTASVSRAVGAGHQRLALGHGISGLWLAVLIGLLVTLPLVIGARPLVELLGASGSVSDHAVTYLQIAALGVTPLLLMLAASGVLRGLHDTTTPLAVAIVGNLANIGLNLVLIYGFDLGIAGAALGTVVAQISCAAALVLVVLRAARRQGAPLAPHVGAVLSTARNAVPLIVRTLCLRGALLATTYAVLGIHHGASSSGNALTEVDLAAHQIAFTIWTFLAFALDALAIAAQTLTGRSLGAGDLQRTRQLTKQMTRWGVGYGALCGLILITLSPVIGRLFSPDQAVQEALIPVLIVIGLFEPLCGLVFVLDGVLIGAGDGAYLAWAGLAMIVLYAPVALLWHENLTHVWLLFSTVLMGSRALFLALRARSNRWMIVGLRA